jgi:hypothetical protein
MLIHYYIIPFILFNHLIPLILLQDLLPLPVEVRYQVLQSTKVRMINGACLPFGSYTVFQRLSNSLNSNLLLLHHRLDLHCLNNNYSMDRINLNIGPNCTSFLCRTKNHPFSSTFVYQVDFCVLLHFLGSLTGFLL